jgi:hypothetical protein
MSKSFSLFGTKAKQIKPLTSEEITIAIGNAYSNLCVMTNFLVCESDVEIHIKHKQTGLTAIISLPKNSEKLPFFEKVLQSESKQISINGLFDSP